MARPCYHPMYDPVVFYTEEEYKELNPGADVNIQVEVEQPEIYLLALGSSGVEDQAALIGDRSKSTKLWHFFQVVLSQVIQYIFREFEGS